MKSQKESLRRAPFPLLFVTAVVGITTTAAAACSLAVTAAAAADGAVKCSFHFHSLTGAGLYRFFAAAAARRVSVSAAAAYSRDYGCCL